MKCISIKTDYSLSSSLIKIDDLILYGVNNSYTTLGVVDDNFSYVYEFYNKAVKNGIKPILGINLKLKEFDLYIYPKTEEDLKELYKLSTYLLDNQLDLITLNKHLKNSIILIPYKSISLYESINKFANGLYIGVKTEEEYNSSLLITKNVVYFDLALSLEQKETKYLNLLLNKKSTSENPFTQNYIKNQDIKFIDEIDIKLTTPKPSIPAIKENIDDFKYLEALAFKGLSKRLNNKEDNTYVERLKYELEVIKSLGFEKYFLIVYDFVLYAHSNKILVGPGRGSAAGSLVSYCIGITNVDPVKYNLIFERFLNVDRVSMPDIDIDFDSEKRDEIIEYLKEKYGHQQVLSILTYSTYKAKQALITVAKIYDINIKELTNLISSQISLKENLNKKVKSLLKANEDYKKVYYEAMKIENLKKNISTHAAGVVIADKAADNYIPILKSGNNYITGITMHYLEDLNLLKIDILGLTNLTMINRIAKDDININEIDLNDKEVLSRFGKGETEGVFQFESSGMTNFLKRLKPQTFNDLVSAIALYRPGPMENIDLFLKNKNSKSITYYNSDLKKILEESYGVIIYQEQVMEILKKVANYSYKEADNIRRAISKKDENIILKEKKNFIEKSLKNNYKLEEAEKIYNLILKFAGYGFNKAHSVSYAKIGYQIMYLKTYYKERFYLELLNSNVGNPPKIKEYINKLKSINVKVLKPSINKSSMLFTYSSDGIRMPLTIVKNISFNKAEEIISNEYKDFSDFIKKNTEISKNQIESLIYSGAFDEFNYTRNTLINNLDSFISYGKLIKDIDEKYAPEPQIKFYSELNEKEILDKEIEYMGFYISDHPASKYSGVKLININDYFDENIKTYAVIEDITKIKTKNNKNMAFLEISDETSVTDIVLFPSKVNYINLVQKDDLVEVHGKVEKRFDKYQIIVNKITKIK